MKTKVYTTKAAKNPNIITVEPDKALGYDFEGKAFKIYRQLPALFTLLLILLPILSVLAQFYPFMLKIILITVIYWLYRGFLVFYSVTVAYLRFLVHKRVDWNSRYKALLTQKQWKRLPTKRQLPTSPKDFRVVCLIPVYKEPYELLEETLQSLVNSEFPIKDHLIVVFALEERGGKKVLEDVKRLHSQYGRFFNDFKYYVHPQNLPGEAIGIAGPNLRWASYNFYREFVQKKGASPLNYLILKFDSDFHATPKFLAALSYKYLTTPNRVKRFFSTAWILYSNNIWRVSPFTRVFSILMTFLHPNEWVFFKKYKASFSTYAMSLKTLADIHFWDPKIGVDDTGFYYQAFIRYKGDFRGEEIYIPGTLDAVEGRGTLDTLYRFWKQQVRWGGGAIVVPMFFATIRRLKIPFSEKLFRIWLLSETYSIWKVVSIYFGLYFPLLMWLFPGVLYETSGFLLAYYLSTILRLSSLMTPIILAFALNVYRQYSPKDNYPFLIRWILLLAEFTIVFPVNTIITSGAYFKAYVDIWLGKFGKFFVVDKFR